MTAKNREKKEARALQAEFGCAYSTALNLLREHGLEDARAKLRASAKSGKDGE